MILVAAHFGLYEFLAAIGGRGAVGRGVSGDARRAFCFRPREQWPSRQSKLPADGVWREAFFIDA